ncbi:LPS O-antigen length regulator [Psychrosphaera saromensis]|uniref:LPS O-antigen length regulator n=1 Tax=Psychrosphaera saromensis TaxID=716813 RepID=A0A2S7V057_9GAMM|nr:LPS O-antigen length regulator [Psychrosphaera saromensis]
MVKCESIVKDQGDEIDLLELWRAIWQGKLLIALVTFVFSVSSVFYALRLPNMYVSEALLAPAEEQGAGLDAMASQLGGLASLAGINLGGGETDKTALALEIIKSRAFVFKFIEKYDITPDLMAVKNWDLASNKLIYNEKVYDSVTNKWLRKVKAPLKAKPSLQEAYKQFQQVITVEQDKINSMVTISVEHYSPYVAQQWVNRLIYAINEEMKGRDLLEANNSITYLNEQLETTRISGLQEILYQLIEEQTKTIMFANVREEYVLKTIDPALVPELKSGPKRSLICVLGFMLGGLLSVLIVLIRHFKNKG